MKTNEKLKALPSEIEEAIHSREIEDFRKKATSDLLEKLLELSDKQVSIAQNPENEKDGKVKLIGWGTFKLPKEVQSMEKFRDWIYRNLMTKPNVDWLHKNLVLEGKEDETLNDLQAQTKQSPEDIGNNQWFYPMFDKLRSLGEKDEGNDTMSVQQLTVLALIAKAGTNGVITKDISETMFTTLSSIQRQLGRLGKGYEFKTLVHNENQDVKVRLRGGLFLIEQFEDPNNRKQKRWVLSSKGVRFFKSLNSVVLKPDVKADEKVEVENWTEVKFSPAEKTLTEATALIKKRKSR